MVPLLDQSTFLDHRRVTCTVGFVLFVSFHFVLFCLTLISCTGGLLRPNELHKNSYAVFRMSDIFMQIYTVS